MSVTRISDRFRPGMIGVLTLIGTALIGSVATYYFYSASPANSHTSEIDHLPHESHEHPVPKQISGGLLNSKATVLPKPVLPRGLERSEIHGSVTVQILIDEEGNVVLASVTDGPLQLREAAVDAAKKAKFPPPKISNVSIKMSGHLVYSFAS